jgi:hypothetical protein
MPVCKRNKLLLVEQRESYARWNGCTREDPILKIPKMCNASGWVEDHEDRPAWSRDQEYDEAVEEVEEVEDPAGEQITPFISSRRGFRFDDPHGPCVSRVCCGWTG